MNKKKQVNIHQRGTYFVWKYIRDIFAFQWWKLYFIATYKLHGLIKKKKLKIVHRYLKLSHIIHQRNGSLRGFIKIFQPYNLGRFCQLANNISVFSGLLWAFSSHRWQVLCLKRNKIHRDENTSHDRDKSSLISNGLQTKQSHSTFCVSKAMISFVATYRIGFQNF